MKKSEQQNFLRRGSIEICLKQKRAVENRLFKEKLKIPGRSLFLYKKGFSFVVDFILFSQENKKRRKVLHI